MDTTPPSSDPAAAASPRRRRVARRASVLAASVAVAAAGAAVAQASSDDSALREVREVTARFHHVAAAEGAGYQRFVDLQGIACIANPGVGAMGVHYVNGGLVGDPAIDALQPEALVYEPEGEPGQGHHLVAAEYIVVKEAWDAANAEPPALFGTTFDTVTSPNRYGLPDFYALHVWIGKHNPAGTYTMWNPNVDC